MLEVKVGDQLRDCDPRKANVTKDVVAVTDEYVTVKKGKKETRIRRDRVHEKADKKKGYFLIRLTGATPKIVEMPVCVDCRMKGIFKCDHMKVAGAVNSVR
jgi:hypothetical protein